MGCNLIAAYVLNPINNIIVVKKKGKVDKNFRRISYLRNVFKLSVFIKGVKFQKPN